MDEGGFSMRLNFKLNLNLKWLLVILLFALMAGQAAAQEYSTKMLNAPIPGKIIAVFVHEGDLVSVGQELLTLEAMKMKNAIRANRDGTIASVLVANGDSVKHGQPLIEFTE